MGKGLISASHYGGSQVGSNTATPTGLIVQGYFTDANQGPGVVDNCIEIDGADDSDAQPVTTTKIANLTVAEKKTALGRSDARKFHGDAGYRYLLRFFGWEPSAASGGAGRIGGSWIALAKCWGSAGLPR